jgi:glycosyltransferase involved in cell wall biosynthesis
MQNYDNLIVYVLDDCSSDQTEKQVQKWLSDPRLHYIRHPKNIGRCANYRYAVNELQDSDWMMILDGDDYYTDPNFIKQAIALSKNNGSIAFIQAGHTTYYDDGSQESVAILPNMSADHEIFTGVNYLQHWFKTGFFSHLGIIFNRSKAMACQMYQENISSSDMESFMRLAKEGAVLVMNSSVGHWRQHANNTSRQLKTVDVAPNVKIFRAISKQWITDGLAKRSDFEPSLTQYEARTYAYLYQLALQEKNIVHSPKELFKSIWEVNPALLMQRKIIKLMLKVILSKIRRS